MPAASDFPLGPSARSQLCHGLDALPAGPDWDGMCGCCSEGCLLKTALLLTELGAAACQAGPVPCLARAPPAPCPACLGLWQLLLVLLFNQEPRQHFWLRPKPVGGHGGAWALNTDSGTIICRKPK